MRKHSLLLAIGLAVFILGVAACGDSTSDKASNPFETLTAQEAYRHLQSGDGAVIVDVRQPEEWAATGVPLGAHLIPLGEIARRAAELPRDRPVLVICNSGNRSLVASETLVRLGFSAVKSVEGGIQAWLKAGLPVEPYSP